MSTELVFGTLLEDTTNPEFIPGNLATKFLQPPFTVLSTRSGDWQERRRAWLSLGLRSELGRGADVLFDQKSQDRLNELNRAGRSAAGRAGLERTNAPGYRYEDKARGAEEPPPATEGFAATSIFDPVLCELIYRWWAPAGGLVLDPFAGGSVRGIVAAKLGHPYTGIDLARDQLVANREQAAAILAPGEPVPHWINGDSTNMDALLPAGQEYDLVFSCPPYFDLEVYSDDPADLSAMDWHGFLQAYEAIIEVATNRLRRGHFAVFVVSEVRGPDGAYRGLVPRTIHAFERVGLRYYNEAILVNAAGSVPLRATKQMEASRKLGRVHQNILCFVKGEPPRGWSYERAAPPSPQLSLFQEAAPPVPAPATTTEPAPPMPASATTPEPVPPVVATEVEPPAPAVQDTTPVPAVEMTPVELYVDVWLKRDDLFEVAGVRGGKVRNCWRLAQGATGLVTAGSRSSPQANIVAHIARQLGIPARLHTPEGELSPELLAAQAAGAEVVQHPAGYNNVIIARAREDAAARGWREIPFGMECSEAVDATAAQVANIPSAVQRIVVPVGSGMSLAGILHGLQRHGVGLQVLGVIVGADPAKRLDRWAPADWRSRTTLVPSGSDYHAPAPVATYRGVQLDAHYEAKCLPWLEPGDLLWCVGIRQSATVIPDSAKAPDETPRVARRATLPPPLEHRATVMPTGCATCGNPPIGTFHDGSPRYDCVHTPFVLFSDKEI